MPIRPRTAFRIKLTPTQQNPELVNTIMNNMAMMENKNMKHRLLMFHDSFNVRGGLREYLAEHFSRSIFIPTQPNERFFRRMIEQEQPDIMIEEIVGRKLKDIPSID